MHYFDVHQHYNLMEYRGRKVEIPSGLKQSEYFEKELVKTCKEHESMVAVNGLGVCDNEMIPMDMNDEVERFFKNNEEYIVGIAYVDLDWDTPKIIDSFYKRGFKGIKVIWTKKPYDSKEYYEFYKRCEYFQFPILFHTGIEGIPFGNWKDGAISFNMNPAWLEAVAFDFPKLNIIGAHLGYGYYPVACALAKSIKIGFTDAVSEKDGIEKRGNLFFDISGSDILLREVPEGGYIKRDIPVSQVIWGSDEPLTRYEEIVNIWKDHFSKINLSKEEQDKIFYKNACDIFNIKY